MTSRYEAAPDLRLVVLESPYSGEVYSGEVALNVMYARAAMRDCLNRGEAPYASHLLYTQAGVLDDTAPSERLQGMAAGFAWGDMAAATVVYTDRGMSSGMLEGVARATAAGRPVEYRTLEGWK